ncbi:antitoxin [Streptococcus cuniculi]|uniref:Antitoxin n=1 Tax=Streptococcus cuniculi TaxID=1432788 RepID=A0A1Q8E9U0_9STRE|nr:antitoxin [Streptococcus cuniculi]OLF48566.1 antitoxin [Streptococcus cuniculi]
MAKTQPVNFRAETVFYQKTKAILADERVTLSDVFNATLRKIATGAVDAREFVSSDIPDSQFQIAFEDLKKEILLGHEQIAQGKVTPLADVRKEFGLD